MAQSPSWLGLDSNFTCYSRWGCRHKSTRNTLITKQQNCTCRISVEMYLHGFLSQIMGMREVCLMLLEFFRLDWLRS